jgi:hypothetical protein
MFEITKIGRHKKASLELSINAIIIIVLALTLLGLGLTFIRSQFKKIGETTGTIQEQIKEQILEDLRTGDKKLSFPSTNVNLDRGSTSTLAFGVKNTESLGDLNFKISIAVTGAKSNPAATEESIAADPAGAPITFFFTEGPFMLGAADSEVYSFQVTDKKNAVDVYKIRIKINSYKPASDGSIDTTVAPTLYAEKTFFLNVG